MDPLVDKFPVWGLLPKKETGVTSFLTKNPEYDGTGVIIAIFDTGVDPGAHGLQQTPDGKTKVIERFDCSGCGDVNMTTAVQAKECIITGISGRKLKIPNKWKNPTNIYRIGIKNSFDLYPERLRERIQEENKEHLWDNQHKTILATANRNLTAFETRTNGQELSESDKLEKENLEAIVEHLTTLEKKYNDVGVYYDCVMFHDGTKWMACVDTSEEGDLEKCKLLGEYSKTHEYGTLTKADQLNYSINVHDNGNVLELVGLCSSHGTHVASITAAYFPDEPERNGIAPGAQIVSLTIGDGRLGSMETGTALVRAMIKVMELETTTPVDIINMSYGERSHWANAGRIGDLMNEIVNKYGVIWVVSAGNQGPAVSTIGTPPDISQETLIGVGAYVSPDMMVAEYAMHTKLSGMLYTWSSRGPTLDGAIGVTICAPGGAITSVPNFTLRNSQLMNGSSMAAPHVAGSVGLLLSGLKKNKIYFSPYNVKRALENGATRLANTEPFTQGSGLLNVEKSYELLTKYHDVIERDVRFHISCGTNNAKGIYIRNKSENSIHEFSISVEPFFLDFDTVTPDIKINFNMKLHLICDAPYVQCPKHLDLSNISRVFGVKINTDGLKGINATFIEAYDVNCVDKGVVFKIPITVIQPVQVTAPNYSLVFQNVPFEPNTTVRNFITVPDNATYAVIRMRSVDVNKVGKFVIHCMQFLPKLNSRALEVVKHLTVSSNSESVLSFQVNGSSTLEVVVAKYWASIGNILIDYNISFYGIRPSQSAITMHASEGIHNIQVTSLQGEEILPNITLKSAVQILKSTESKISPLSSRDVILPGRQIYGLVSTYNFHLNRACEISPICPLLCDLLYESEFESQLWMLFDCNKQYLGCGDAYPSKYNVKLEKGDYVIKMHIRHDKKDYLEKLQDANILLHQKLATTLSLDVYSHYCQALISGKKAAVGHALHSSTVSLYIAPLPSDKYDMKSNNAAHYLLGTVTFAKDELAKRVDTYPVRYFLSENNRKAAKPVEKTKSKQEEYREALLELKTTWLSKLDVMEVATSLYAELLKEFPDHLHVHTAYLQSIDPMDAKHQLPLLNKTALQAQKRDDLVRIIEICNKVIDNINQVSLVMHLSFDQRTESLQIKQMMKRQKTVLIDCLCRKGIAICRLLLMNDTECDESNVQLISKNLSRFVDCNDTKVFSANVMYFACWQATLNEHYGKLLKYLRRINEEKPTKEVYEKIIEVYELMNWTHLVTHFKRKSLAKFPVNYRPF